MANQGAKKRLEANKKRIQLLQYALLGSFGIFALLRFVLFRSSTTTLHYVGFSLAAFSCYFCYATLSHMAKPLFDHTGELVDGGSDLSLGGLTGYYHDWIYISCFVLATASLSNYMWWTYIVVPLYGLYQLVVKVIAPGLVSGGQRGSQLDPSQLDPATRKKLAKAEARAERRQAKSMSRR